MQAIFDDRGFVLSFAFIGDLVGGTELPDPEDFDLFMHKFYAFQLVDGKLVYNETEYETHLTEELKAEYRKRRETECFAVVNRGQLWYETITWQQILELRAWYKAWLNVTETMVVPDKPSWLT